MADHSDPHYAVMRTTRIKSMQHALWVGKHNGRTMDVPNLDPEARMPNWTAVGDSRPLPEQIQDALDRFDPMRNEDGVLALEFVMSASRAAFDGLSEDDRNAKAIVFAVTCLSYLKARYPHDGQIVALVLHLDERTPHCHAVVLPLDLRADLRGRTREYYKDAEGKRRYRTTGEAPMRSMLSASRDMGGKGRLARHQTEFAKAMEPLGLSRGRHRSGGRNVSNREHEEMLAAAVARAEARESEAAALLASLQDREAGMVRDRASLDAMLADAAAIHARAVEAEARAAEAVARAVLAEDAANASRDRAAALEARMQADRAAVQERLAEVETEKARARGVRDKYRARVVALAEMRASARELREWVIAQPVRTEEMRKGASLAATFEAKAKVVRDSMDAKGGEQLQAETLRVWDAMQATKKGAGR